MSELRLSLGLGPSGYKLFGNQISKPTGIVVSNTSIDDSHTGAFATLFMVGGTEPATFAIDNGPSWLSLTGDVLSADGTQDEGSTDVTFSVVDANDFEFVAEPITFTITLDPADDPELPDDGDTVITDPEDPNDGFEGDVVEAPTNEGLQITAKNKGHAAFLKEVIGHPQPGYTYTMLVDPDWSNLNQQGRDACLGFGLLDGTDFHLVGLQGVSRNSQAVNTTKIYGDFNVPKDFSIDTVKSAAHGTKDGPSWYQFYWHPDGETYTFRTGPYVNAEGDGKPFFVEVTGPITPITDLGIDTKFGPAAYFSGNDKGVSITKFLRWYITEGATEMFLSDSGIVDSSDEEDTEIGQLTAMGGTPPYTYSIVV